MVAALSALNAFAIDIMLPAFPYISAAFALTNANDSQLVIVAYVAAFGVAQLVYGPLADAFGRRSVLIWALLIFAAGSLICTLAPSFELLLAARVLQGLGAAATRVISTAVVRDLTSGRAMARVMSLAMSLFMIVPILAPGIGQLILLVSPWRTIFGVLLCYILIILAWAYVRLPETLPREARTSFKLPAIMGAYATVLRNRVTIGYTVASTLMAGALFGYIATSQQIFVDVYRLGAMFPFAFASVAVMITCGTLVNSRLVMRLGMRRISHAMTCWFTAIACIHYAIAAASTPPFWQFLSLLALSIGAFGMIAGNFNALAMEPMGANAGAAAAVYGASTSAGGGLIGGLVAYQFDGTPAPFLAGVALLGALTLIAILVIERGRLFGDGDGAQTPR